MFWRLSHVSPLLRYRRPSLHRLRSYLLIATGGLSFLSATFGVCGTMTKAQCLLFISICMLTLTFFAQIPTLYYLFEVEDLSSNVSNVDTLLKHRTVSTYIDLGILGLQLLFGMTLYCYYTSFQDDDDKEYQLMNGKNKSYQRLEDKRREREIQSLESGVPKSGVNKEDRKKEVQRGDLYDKYPHLRARDKEATRMAADYKAKDEGGGCAVM
jgi:hypothetical protein